MNTEVKDTTWYTIKVRNNRERKVSERLTKEANRREIDNIKTILIPTEKYAYVKNGKKVDKERVVYPGYVFLEIYKRSELPQIEHILKDIEGCSGILKNKSGDPEVITESEIKRMIGTIEEKNKNVSDEFIEGEMVLIVDGPFSGMRGTISFIKNDQVRLDVLIFNVSTHVDLKITSISKNA